ncbi:MAG TPA: 2'-deoxycytidine 5'-triphosphate deaminase [Gammaproteobacteria bacterium]|jgi:deoxycytidine triphosphate deaminase|nr:2'-deoxycytidine 5'-triphosphate deaminase [Gammaproteobacteria bacterium]
MSKTDMPWDEWVPGALSYRQIQELINEDLFNQHDEFKGELDHSSIDLTLSSECYELPHGSVKPFGSRYLNRVKRMGLAVKYKPDKEGIFLLKQRNTYLFKLQERIPLLRSTCIYGQATAKSTVGRMDVLARLIVDGMQTYEEFLPAEIGNGDMYIEITPMTFNVRVKQGISLNQIRLFKGTPQDCEIRSTAIYNTVITNTESTDGSLSLDTSTVTIEKSKVSVFRTVEMKPESPAIDLWQKHHADPHLYWEFVEGNKHKRIEIAPTRFHIMRSYERIAVPKGIAVYCRASDETIGEMRIHYAGFAHPYFGYKNGENAQSKPEPVGTPLVFEVRGHDVKVSLMHREKMARLIFYRMSEDANLESKPIKDDDAYQHQSLQLSKCFKNWSEK